MFLHFSRLTLFSLFVACFFVSCVENEKEAKTIEQTKSKFGVSFSGTQTIYTAKGLFSTSTVIPDSIKNEFLNKIFLLPDSIIFSSDSKALFKYLNSRKVIGNTEIVTTRSINGSNQDFLIGWGATKPDTLHFFINTTGFYQFGYHFYKITKYDFTTLVEKRIKYLESFNSNNLPELSVNDTLYINDLKIEYK